MHRQITVIEFVVTHTLGSVKFYRFKLWDWLLSGIISRHFGIPRDGWMVKDGERVNRQGDLLEVQTFSGKTFGMISG